MVRLSDNFCSNSYENLLWVDRRSVGQQTVGRRTGARSVETHRLACLALWSSVTTELGKCLWGVSVSCNSFEGKIELEMVLHSKPLILQSTRNINSVWPNFQYLPNTHAGVKAFLEILWSQNKCSLNYKIQIRLKGKLNRCKDYSITISMLMLLSIKILARVHLPTFCPYVMFFFFSSFLL